MDISAVIVRIEDRRRDIDRSFPAGSGRVWRGLFRALLWRLLNSKIAVGESLSSGSFALAVFRCRFRRLSAPCALEHHHRATPEQFRLPRLRKRPEIFHQR